MKKVQIVCLNVCAHVDRQHGGRKHCIACGAKGICTTTVSACASGTHSIGEAFRNIKHGYADVMIAGGSESTICEIGIAGFASLTALTTESDPDKASTPFDKTAAGLLWEKVLGF